MNAATPVPAAAPASTTADDTLQRKSRDAGVVSGGHLVAKALKNEGVDTIFTLCGGHIIDIYDGCIDEGIRIIDVRHEQVAAHAADGYARQTGKLGCVVTTAGPGCTNAVTGIATAFRSESPVLHIGGQGALTQHKMGSLQDLPHVDMMSADHQVRRERTEHRARRRHDFDGGARSIRGRRRAGVSGDSARRARSRGRHQQGGDTASRATIAPRPARSAIRATSRSWRTFWSTPSARPSFTVSRYGRRAVTRRPSRCCAASTSPATSTAAAAACCPRAIRIISTARAATPLRTPTSSSSSARRSTFAWATAGASATSSSWCRSTWTTARSARTATSISGWSATRAPSWARCCRQAPDG